MEKNWLIRTKSNHILGPVSKEKVLELYKNSSIKREDEICSGNGFWFYLRETDMVDRFLTGDEVQGFNPMSEAKDILTGSRHSKEPTLDDVTLVKALNVKEPQSDFFQEVAHLDNPQDDVNSPTDKESKKKIKPETRPVSSVSMTSAKVPTRQQGFLKYLMILCFIALLFLLYFRKIILQNIFSQIAFLSMPTIINVAQAQENSSNKKKSF